MTPAVYTGLAAFRIDRAPYSAALYTDASLVCAMVFEKYEFLYKHSRLYPKVGSNFERTHTHTHADTREREERERKTRARDSEVEEEEEVAKERGSGAGGD